MKRAVDANRRAITGHPMIFKECIEIPGGVWILVRALCDSLNTTMRECTEHNILDVSVGALAAFCD